MFKKEVYHLNTYSLSVVEDFMLRRYGQQFQLCLDRVKMSYKKLSSSSSNAELNLLGVSSKKLFTFEACHLQSQIKHFN